jgi:hypothetical protein
MMLVVVARSTMPKVTLGTSAAHDGGGDVEHAEDDVEDTGDDDAAAMMVVVVARSIMPKMTLGTPTFAARSPISSEFDANGA